MTIAFRPANLVDNGRDSERAFVRATWSRAFKKSFDAGMIWTDDWERVMHPQIDRVLDRTGTRVVLAYETESPTFLYGWIAGDTSEDTPVVFFAYVKEPYRRQGFGRELLQALGVDAREPFTYTCRTSVVRHLRGKIPLGRYNPLEVRYPKQARRGTWQPKQ